MTNSAQPSWLSQWMPWKWIRYGKTFSVVVNHHTTPSGAHRWCVYLHLSPGHPAFKLCRPDQGMIDQPYFACHSYMSFFQPHYGAAGNITSFQLGWDYNHDGDYYDEDGNPEDVPTVFWDADRLYEQALEWEREHEAI